MNYHCFYNNCPKKVWIFCDCSENITFSCSDHLCILISLPKNHNPQKISELPEIRASGLQYCEGKKCEGFGKVFCHCNSKIFCLSCLHVHLAETPKIVHNTEVRAKPQTFEGKINPIDLIGNRINCAANAILRIKERNISVLEILTWDLKTLNNECLSLGIDNTTKGLLWNEINYVKIVTEKICLKEEFLPRLSFVLENSENNQ